MANLQKSHLCLKWIGVQSGAKIIIISQFPHLVSLPIIIGTCTAFSGNLIKNVCIT